MDEFLNFYTKTDFFLQVKQSIPLIANKFQDSFPGACGENYPFPNPQDNA